MLFLLPLAALAAGGVYYAKTRAKKSSTVAGEASALSPERKEVFDNALAKVKDPSSLRTLAASFRSEGLHLCADKLEKRARLRALPKPIIKERRAAFKKALSSKDKNAVLTMAERFDDEGATGCAQELRAYAAGLT